MNQPGDSERRQTLPARAFRLGSGPVDLVLRGFTRAARAVWEFYNGPIRSRTGIVMSYLVFIGLFVLLAIVTQQEGFFCVGLVLLFFIGTQLTAFRYVAGGVVAGLIAVLGAGVMVVVVPVLVAVVLVAVVVFVVSLVVALPLRLLQSLSLRRKRIAYRCPYDDCGGTGLPLHLCSCGRAYDELRPNRFGVLHHVCSHEGKAGRLPTLDCLGRNALWRVCRHCRRTIAYPSFGKLRERLVLVVGGAGAGKTLFLRQGTRSLCNTLSAMPGNRAAVDAGEQDHELKMELAWLDSGQLLTAVTVASPPALGVSLRLRRPHPLHCLLYLFDSPGKHFTTMEQLGRKHTLEHVDGLVLIVDPFSLPTGPGALERRDERNPVTPLQQVVGTFLVGVTQALLASPMEQSDVPLAVVLSKCDVLSDADRQKLGSPESAGASARCRELLARLGAANELRALEHRFAHVRYFACTALGRPASPQRPEPFQARGVIEPMLWLLGLNESDDDQGGNTP